MERPTNDRNIINSSDVIERIEWLKAELESYEGAETIYSREYKVELETLNTLADQCKKLNDSWEDGITLIRYSYFKDYAQELMEQDSGFDMFNLAWPFTHIDWDAAVKELKLGYISVDFDGVEYFMYGI